MSKASDFDSAQLTRSKQLLSRVDRFYDLMAN